MNIPNDEKEIHLSLKELTTLFESYGLHSLRREFFEKIALLIIAALGFITALAWEEALKITFHELFTSLSPLGERFIYPIIITALTVIISVGISRFFLKKEKSK